MRRRSRGAAKSVLAAFAITATASRGANAARHLCRVGLAPMAAIEAPHLGRGGVPERHRRPGIGAAHRRPTLGPLPAGNGGGDTRRGAGDASLERIAFIGASRGCERESVAVNCTAEERGERAGLVIREGEVHSHIWWCAARAIPYTRNAK
jgi:hypothetical protein